MCLHFELFYSSLCLHCLLHCVCLFELYTDLIGYGEELIENKCFVCAVRLEASLEHWYVTGLQQQGIVPSLISTVGDLDCSLLSILFELNPEKSTADQLLCIHSQPVEIIYDAVRHPHQSFSQYLTIILL